MNEADAFGVALFCDDIRHEVGGKVSFIGAYRSAMFVNTDFPIMLPKLGVGITYWEKKGKLDGKATILIYLPGDEDRPSIEAELPMEDARNSLSNPSKSWLKVQTEILFSPIEIKQPGYIKVRIQRGEDRIKLGRLKVKKHESKRQQSNAEEVSK